MFQIVSVSGHLNERQKIKIEVDERQIVLDIKIKWHEAIKQWMISIWDEAGFPKVMNVPLLSGVGKYSANVLKPFDSLEIGSLFVLPNSDEGWGRQPNKSDLMTDFSLIWGDKR